MEKAREFIRKYGGFVIGVIVLIFVVIAMFMGKVTVVFGSTSFTADCTLLSGKTTVHYEDIDEVYLDDDIDRGSREFGVGSATLQAGKFENDEFGNYKLYSYTSSELFVVVKYEGDSVLVLGMQDDAATQAAYEKLLTFL